MGKNKQVVCKKCCRVMRNDNLNRHMKQHSKRNESNPVRFRFRFRYISEPNILNKLNIEKYRHHNHKK